MTIDFEALAAPFPAADLDWRVGNKSSRGDKATLLVYLTSRAVMQRLDDVVGPAGWRDAYSPLVEGMKTVGYLCELSVEVAPGQWVSKVDGADLTDIEAIKGGISSALKRAAVKWGIGRYLYDVDSAWHKILDGYGPDGKSVYCPIGAEKKPGHILIPVLADKYLPKPKKPKAKVPDPTPEHQQVADEVAAARQQRADADKARRDLWDPSWDGAGQSSFCGAVGKMGLNPDLAMDLAETVGPRKRPSSMTPGKRAEFLVWLQSDAGRLAYDALVAEREMAARETA